MRADRGADPHRARYHSSVMDVENLDAGQQFSDLPDTYTIFITEKDFFEEGAPVYWIQNMNLTTGKPFNDGAYILYVNGEYRGEDDLGRLMHDFNCTDAEDMHFELMAERTKYLKENPEGVSIMCKAMEEMRNEALARGENTFAKLMQILFAQGRVEDARRASEDMEYRHLLMQELAISV